MFKPMHRGGGPSSQSCAPRRLPEHTQAWFLPFLYLSLGAIVALLCVIRRLRQVPFRIPFNKARS